MRKLITFLSILFLSANLAFGQLLAAEEGEETLGEDVFENEELFDSEEPADVDDADDIDEPEVDQEPTDVDDTDDIHEPEIDEEPADIDDTDDIDEPEVDEEPADIDDTDDIDEPEVDEEPTDVDDTDDIDEPKVDEEPVETSQEDYESPEEVYTQEYIDDLNFTEIYNNYIHENITNISDNYPTIQDTFEVRNIEWIGSNTAKVSYYDGDNKYVGEVELGWWNGEVQFEGYSSVKSDQKTDEKPYDVDEDVFDEEPHDIDTTEQIDTPTQQHNISDKASKSFEEREQIIQDSKQVLTDQNIQECREIKDMIDSFVQNVDNYQLLQQRLQKLDGILEQVDNMNLDFQQQNLSTSVLLYLKNSFEERISELGGDTDIETDGGLEDVLEDLLEN